MARVLAIVAHPDDEILGCGGVLALHAEEGDTVKIAILGQGMRSRDAYEDSEADALRSHAREAAAALGIDDLLLESLPDNRFDSLPRLDVVKVVEQVVRDFEPSVVYTHHPGDLNVDHGVTCAAVLTALRPLPGEPPCAILAFETLSSSEWAFGPEGPPFRPNWYVDIGSVLERKLRALEAYRSEIRDYPHPRSKEGIEVAARRAGMTIGVPFAESFELLRLGPGPLPS